MVFTCKVVELRGAASARAAAVTTGSSPEALLLEVRFTRLAAVTTYTQHPQGFQFCLAKGYDLFARAVDCLQVLHKDISTGQGCDS